MGTGSDKYIDHDLYVLHRHLQLAGKQLGIVAIPDIDAFEKFLAVFSVFRACVHLIHKTVFCSMEFCGEIRHFTQKSFDVKNLVEGCAIKSSSTFAIQWAVASSTRLSLLSK